MATTRRYRLSTALGIASFAVLSCIVACAGTTHDQRGGRGGGSNGDPDAADDKISSQPFFIRAQQTTRKAPRETCDGAGCSSGVQYPNVAPLDMKDWRTSGWCTRPGSLLVNNQGGEGEGEGGIGGCPDDAIAAWVRVHIAARRNPREGRFLACKPMGGLGNFITGTVSCLAMAMATNRSLLMARPPKQPGDRPTYAEPVESLFDLPIDTSLAPLGSDVADVPIVMPGKNDKDETGLELIDIRYDDLFCRDLSSSYTAPIAVMPAHLWLGSLADGPGVRDFFTASFGRDDYGVSPVVSFLGPWFFRPQGRLLSLLSSLHSLLTGGTDGGTGGLPIIAVQARVGHEGGEYYDDRPPQGSGPDYVRCAFSQTPLAMRGGARAWVLAGDRVETRAAMLEAAAMSEGPIVAASGLGRLRRIAPKWLFAAGNIVQEEPAMEGRLAEYGFVVAVFASGSRALVLVPPEGEDGMSRPGMEAALLEMWLLGFGTVLVVSENSTFWVPGVTFARGWGAGWGVGRTRGVYVFTRGRRCYPIPNLEPPTDGGHRMRNMWRSPCWDDSQLTPGLTWLPEEKRGPS